MDGRLVEVFPATSSIVGKDFSFRDWYKGVTRTRQTYVSEAYQSQATGHPLVVAVTTLIRAPSVAKRPGRPLGILVAAYGLSAIQRLADNFAKSQRVTLTVTDQRGTLLASPGSNLAPLASRRADPVVAAALRGASGVTTWKRAGREELVAYNPIEKLGWTVAASIPTRSALAPVAHGKLTPEEFEAMKVHTTVGGKILGRSQSDLLRMSEEIALTHHEWWDGRGYPRGLRGDEIPLCGRIVAVADVFDALTHRRPYKEAWPVERALSEIDGSRGKQFDPQVVEILAALPRDILSEPPEERLAA